jgi:hypothetical protein
MRFVPYFGCVSAMYGWTVKQENFDGNGYAKDGGGC